MTILSPIVSVVLVIFQVCNWQLTFYTEIIIWVMAQELLECLLITQSNRSVTVKLIYIVATPWAD